MFRKGAKQVGFWQVNADTLATSRFVVSPLAETVACLRMLHDAEARDPAGQAWLGEHRPAYRARLAGDPVTALLVAAMLRPAWTADFITPPPGGDGAADFACQLDTVRRTSPAAVLADLTQALGGPVPDALNRDDLPHRAASVVDWVWQQTVLPYWRRRRRILEADIVARTAQLSQHGWVAALGDMTPGMRWLGDGRLQINAHDSPPRDISGAQLFFVPVTPRRGWVSWDEPHRYAVNYPCSGALIQDAQRATPPATLSALLGPGRAAVLAQLSTPMSTTQLVALTGQGLGSVGRHLKILLAAGLVRRRRAGRSVLYYRTDAGHTLVAAQRSSSG
jgi:DNA-binding transcriptional ArsR family regulator